MVMLVAAVISVLIIAAGFRALGKGLVLGVIFSMVNFSAMAVLMPLQFHPNRNKSAMVSMGSILLRFGLMAIPMVVAIKSSQFALSTVIVGLFGVQIAILSDHLWARFRDSREAKH
jgi:hypothetical protein